MKIGRDITLASPVNWACPLNRGLTCWWLCLPQWMGGGTWRDLCGRAHGTLTSIDPSSAWLPSNRPGGCGALEFASSQSVDCPGAANRLSGQTKLTWMTWVRPTSLVNGSFLVNNGLSLYTTINASARCDINTRGTSSGNHAPLMEVVSPSIVAGEWLHIATVINADTDSHATYYNGRLVVSSSTAVSDFDDADNSYQIGGANFPGQIDDQRLFVGVAKSASEIWDIYQDSLRGYPRTLKRAPAIQYGKASAPAGFRDPMGMFGFFRRAS
jgi:hypothetical protein